VFVLYSKIFILESFQYRIFNEFVVATVLALIGKSALPTIAAGQVGARQKPNSPGWPGDVLSF
jgi:hypothetical protein